MSTAAPDAMAGPDHPRWRTLRWQPAAAGLLAGAGGFIALGAPGLSWLLVGPALWLLPPAWRLGALVPLAMLPMHPLGDPATWATLALLLGAAAAVAFDVVRPERASIASAATMILLVLAGALLLPRLGTHFAADAGLGALFAGGAALASLGLGVSLVQGALARRA